MQQRRVAIVRNPAKREAEAIMASLVDRVGQQALLAFTGSIDDAESLARARADRVIVLGGDGSILAVARALDGRQSPLVGVNFGKLGYLAEFGQEDVIRHLDTILEDESIISRRMMLEAVITRADGDSVRSVAVNDCVIHAGPPFRMIDLAISVNGEEITSVRGDGLVLSTPTGSTAHNMSAGGPIVQSEVAAIVLTPLSPHSLTHRPLVVSGDSAIEVLAREVNAGTTVAVDGQLSLPLHGGDRLLVRRHGQSFQLARNPSQARWHTLTTKLKWGQ